MFGSGRSLLAVMQGRRASPKLLGSNLCLKKLGIDLAEEIGVKPLNGRSSVPFIDNKAEVDVGGPVRHHQDIDVRKAAEGTSCHSRCVFEVTSDQTYQRGFRCDLDISQLS